MAKKSETLVREVLDRCDVEIGGDRAFDVVVHDDRLYDRVLTQGTLGLGEAYMQGWWDCAAIDELIYRLHKVKAADIARFDVSVLWSFVRGSLLNLQRWRPFDVGRQHYDLSNQLYAEMLDKRMTYSCGYWDNVADLDSAQEAKLDLICRKIGLSAGDRVLDIGAGWGSFLKYAAERYGISGLGVTVSKQQADFANDSFNGYPIENRLMDYHALEGRFDHLVSVGMFEHVGYKNFRAYMQKAHELLDDDGLFLLHTIGGNTSETHGDPWSEKYIFPNGMLPSVAQLGRSVEGLFVIEDLHNFGAHYDRTLLAWHKNFEAAWPRLQSAFDTRFYRMWRYYLLSFAGTFRARHIQLWQVVLSKSGVPGGYHSVR